MHGSSKLNLCLSFLTTSLVCKCSQVHPLLNLVRCLRQHLHYLHDKLCSSLQFVSSWRNSSYSSWSICLYSHSLSCSGLFPLYQRVVWQIIRNFTQQTTAFNIGFFWGCFLKNPKSVHQHRAVLCWQHKLSTGEANFQGSADWKLLDQSKTRFGKIVSCPKDIKIQMLIT